MKIENYAPSLLPESEQGVRTRGHKTLSCLCLGFAGNLDREGTEKSSERVALVDGEKRRGGEYLDCIVSRFLCFVA